MLAILYVRGLKAKVVKPIPALKYTLPVNLLKPWSFSCCKVAFNGRSILERERDREKKGEYLNS